MTLQPIRRSSVADAVHEQIRGEILTGRYDPGQALPAERNLAELLGVNRGAVREAIQRLATEGLVASRQGAGTVVLDFRQQAGLDLLPSLLVGEAGIHGPAVRAVAELRACIGADAARLAATRLTPAAAARLSACAEEMARATDLSARQQAALDLWQAVIEASDNLAYRLAMNSLTRAYQPVQALLAQVLAPELDDVASHQVVVQAILDRDADAAFTQARALLSVGGQALTAVALALEVQP
ncbi:GntR family transcriptional regulator [Myxococcota bacterium]|nr:GntR family transcriptional regulator [Myxococcota bacterium]